MDIICFGKEFEKETCHLFVTDIDIVGPLDQRAEIIFFPDCTSDSNRCRHRNHENTINGNAGFEYNGDPDAPDWRYPGSSESSNPSRLLFSNDNHAMEKPGIPLARNLLTHPDG